MATALLDQSGPQLTRRLEKMGVTVATLAAACSLGIDEVQAALAEKIPCPLAIRIFTHLFEHCGSRTRTNIITTIDTRAALTDSEIWRPIPTAEGYECSNLGHIRRRARGHRLTAGPLLRPMRRKRSDHLHVSLTRRDGTGWTVSVHRVVAITFHGNPPTPDHMACHKNGIGLDCRASNLYWGTQDDNTRDWLHHRDNGKDVRWFNSDPYDRRIRLYPRRSGTS